MSVESHRLLRAARQTRPVLTGRRRIGIVLGRPGSSHQLDTCRAPSLKKWIAVAACGGLGRCFFRAGPHRRWDGGHTDASPAV